VSERILPESERWVWATENARVTQSASRCQASQFEWQFHPHSLSRGHCSDKNVASCARRGRVTKHDSVSVSAGQWMLSRKL
jgi:hypothetical protein